jgi:hypothetical protein
VSSFSAKINEKDRVRGRIHKIDQPNPGVGLGNGRIDLNAALSN